MYKVTNKNGFQFSAKFDGQEYLFPVNEAVYCPDDAGKHIFGIGSHDKTSILSRHGWAPFSGGMAEGLAILAKFKFEHVVQRLDAPFALVEHGPAPVSEDFGGAEGAADDARKAPPNVDGSLVEETKPTPPRLPSAARMPPVTQ